MRPLPPQHLQVLVLTLDLRVAIYKIPETFPKFTGFSEILLGGFPIEALPPDSHLGTLRIPFPGS